MNYKNLEDVNRKFAELTELVNELNAQNAPKPKHASNCDRKLKVLKAKLLNEYSKCAQAINHAFLKIHKCKYSDLAYANNDYVNAMDRLQDIENTWKSNFKNEKIYVKKPTAFDIWRAIEDVRYDYEFTNDPTVLDTEAIKNINDLISGKKSMCKLYGMRLTLKVLSRMLRNEHYGYYAEYIEKSQHK